MSNYPKFRPSKFQRFKESKIQRFKDSKIRRFKDSKIQRFLGLREDNIIFDSFILLSAHSWPYRFILGILFAPVPFPGPGPALLLATRLELAMSHEPRAEQNAKNETIRP